MSLSILSGEVLSMRSPNVNFDLMALSNNNNILYSTLRIGPGEDMSPLEWAVGLLRETEGIMDQGVFIER